MLLDIRPASIPSQLLLADRGHWPVCWIFQNRIGSSPTSITCLACEHGLDPMVALPTNAI
jgi:hypothetical protein